jgi:hypothetical protein
METYLLLAKNTTGKAAIHLIQQATSSPDIFNFVPLLEHDNINRVCVVVCGLITRFY